jgi:hypothetical protein
MVKLIPITLVALFIAVAYFYRKQERELMEPERPIRKGWMDLDPDEAANEARNIIAEVK